MTDTAPGTPSLLTRSLVEAWDDKATRAFDHIDHAMRAPALFKPEDVEATMGEVKRCQAHGQRAAIVG